MSILWILEKPRAPQESLTCLLQGDFAVRSFASVRSFLRIAPVCGRLPDLIIIRSDDYFNEISDLENILCLRFEGLPRCYVGIGPIIDPSKPDVNFVAESSFLQIPFLVPHLLKSSVEQDKKGYLQIDDLLLDSVSHRLRVLPDGDWLKLAPKESQILRYFARNPNLCLSHEDLVLAIWKDVKVSTRSMASHISRLRRYLEGSQIEIRNVYGGGYQLCCSGADARD